MRTRFNFHSDLGHGWLAVPVALLFKLGIHEQITVYSYLYNRTAYLEEDHDMQVFTAAFEREYKQPVIVERLGDVSSYRVRNFPSYKAPKVDGKFTREDYLAGRCTHRQFYGQFVTDAVKQVVLRSIGLERLMWSKDREHLNDIHLRTWDGMQPSILECRTATSDILGLGNSQAESCCLAKEAALQIIEAEVSRQNGGADSP